MAELLVTSRNVRGKVFGAEPGPTRFLRVPGNRKPEPGHAIARRDWVKDVMSAGHWGQDSHTGEDCGDIAVLVHGYNTSPGAAVRGHRQFRKALSEAGFPGVLVSFDWPSDDRAINYLEDRSDAKLTALRLVDNCITLLAATQFRGCRFNVHVIAHSMGGYVVREAFDDADDRPAIAANNWTVSQLCLVGADISSGSMSANDARTRSLYRHCTRLTNYQNPYDRVLKLSNVKRAGVAPRVGRRGLPDDHADKAVNVNCGARFRETYPGGDDNGHSWYFTDAVFIADLVATLSGDTDRYAIAKRRVDSRGDLHLV
jgi:esterase/lipase superfamily enzyme